MEEKYTNIKERILYFAKNQGFGVENFLSSIGMTYGSFKGKAKKGSINSDALEEIYTKYPQLNYKWLLTGQGEMLLSEEKKEMIPSPTGEGVPLIPLEAFAGFGTGAVQVMDYEAQRYVVPEFTEMHVDFMIRIKGSSMYPKYNSGDIVACKKLALNDVFFQWNKVYVLDTDQGALIKRIKPGSDDEHITLRSDNESYDPFELHRSKINAIALVVGVIRFE